MKPQRFLSFGLAAAAMAIVFWSRERTVEEPPRFAPASEVRQERPPSRALGEHRVQSPLVVWPAENSAPETLASIRVKLARMNETPKANKGAEDELMTELLSLLTDENAGEITQALSAEELNSRFGLAALQHWLKMDGVAAADWVAARPNATDEQAWVVASRLVEDDALLESYCARLREGAWREMFLKQAALGSMSENPPGALRLVQGMKRGEAQQELLQTTACSWVLSNPGPASDWIAHVPDSLLREQLICAGVTTYASIDPVASISWLINSIPSPSEATEPLVEKTVRDVFGTWAESNPAQAAQAMTRFPRGDLRDATVSLVSRCWLERDPAAAATWIKTLPERDRIQAMFRLE